MDEIGQVAFVEREGPTYRQVPVMVSAPVQPYEPVVVELPSRDGLWFYGRVIEATEVNYEATPLRMRRRQAYDIPMDPRREDSPELFRIATVEILGALREANGRLEVLEAEVLPETGARVFRMPPRMTAAAFGIPEDGLDLGTLAVGVRAPFRLSREALARGIGIFGRPGTGKSYAAGVLIEEMRRVGLPVLIVDVNGETIETARALGGVTLVPGRDFQIPLRYLEFSELEALLPRLTEVHVDYIAAAFQELLEADRDFGIEDLASKTEKIGASLGAQKGAEQRAAGRVRFLRRDPLIWDPRPSPGPQSSPRRGIAAGPEDWARLFRERGVVNVYVGGLTQERRDMVVAALCRMLQSYRERDLVPPFAFALDEAHAFIPSGGSETASRQVIRNFVRRGRHLKTASVLISQSPAGIDRQILLLLNFRLIFALDGEDLRALSGFLADAPDELIGRIPKLPQGRALAAGGMEILRHVVLVRIRERRTPHGAPTPDLAAEAQAWLARRGRREG